MLTMISGNKRMKDSSNLLQVLYSMHILILAESLRNRLNALNIIYKTRFIIPIHLSLHTFTERDVDFLTLFLTVFYWKDRKAVLQAIEQQISLLVKIELATHIPEVLVVSIT